MYHKFLNLTYLVDLNSTHGTFIGSIRLEAHKPTVVQINSSFHFGASTRFYTLRERIKTQSIVEDLPMNEILGLPESQDDVDNLTEYNTANNRKISTLGISENTVKKGTKRKRVHFNEEEIVINPEDIDPLVGKFRNLVQSTVIPISTSKKMRLETPFFSSPPSEHKHHPIIAPSANLYAGLPSTSGDIDKSDESYGLYSSLPSLNPAPEIDSTKPVTNVSQVQFKNQDEEILDAHEPKKKKYAKETWFGPKKAPKAFGDI